MTQDIDRFQIIFKKLDEAIKNQNNIRIQDFSDLINISEEIRTLKQIVNDALLEEETVTVTRA